MPRTIDFQVVLVEGHGYVFASIPDLECDAVASVILERLAARALEHHADTDALPPVSRLSLASLCLPRSSPRLVDRGSDDA
jgi:hypothetical protein